MMKLDFSDFECAMFVSSLPSLKNILTIEQILGKLGYQFAQNLGYLVDINNNFQYPSWTNVQDAYNSLNEINLSSYCLCFLQKDIKEVLSMVIYTELSLISLDVSERVFIDQEKNKVDTNKLKKLIALFEIIANFFTVTHWRIDPSDFDYSLDNNFIPFKKNSAYPENIINDIIYWYDNTYLRNTFSHRR